MKHTALFLFIAVLLVAACGPTHEERLAQLVELERQNVADSLMTNDTLALQLAEYFDQYGTPNELLRAYYILGRTYTDLGDAPLALASYQNAVMNADTTADDCDYAKLSRVYGWISDILYKQNLMEDYMESIDLSVDYAWKAKDTLQALGEKARKVMAYIKMSKPDSLLVMFDEVFNEMIHYAGVDLASKYSLIPVKTLLNRNELEKARSLLNLYEQHSGFVDSAGNVAKGREQFYYYKGCYYQLSQQLDSAEYYFRKVLQDNKGFFEQNAGAYGLAKLFSQQQRYDSASKYALYSYVMNDSLYTHKVTDEVERATALFNYTRHQQIANREHIRADNERAQKEKLYIILFLVLAIAGIVLSIIVRKRRQAREQYQLKVRELAQISRSLEDMQKQKAVFEALASEEIMQKSTELATIQQQNETLAQQIKDANASLTRLKQEIMRLQNNSSLTSQEANALIEASPVYQRLQEKAGGCAELTDSEWQAIEKLVKTTLPGFYSLITSRQYSIRQEGRRLCFLLRLHVGLKEASVLMGISRPNISKLSKGILSCVFGEEGSGKELIKRLEYIF